MTQIAREREEDRATYLDSIGATSGADLIRTLAERLTEQEQVQEQDDQAA